MRAFLNLTSFLADKLCALEQEKKLNKFFWIRKHGFYINQSELVYPMITFFLYIYIGNKMLFYKTSCYETYFFYWFKEYAVFLINIPEDFSAKNSKMENTGYFS